MLKIEEMATKNEKILGTLLGAGLGGIIASKHQAKQKNDIGEPYDLWYMLKGVFLVGISGYGLASIFGSPNNTVNYSLYNGNKRVYDGITFNHRIASRELEHIKSGKMFTKMVIDNPKPRTDAIRLEKKLIKKHRPIYNIQYNK
jgi:hypothetical protein